MTSKDYWQRRALRLEKLLHDRAGETVQQVARLYGLAQEEIYRQIEAVFDAYARKGGIVTQEQAMTLLSQRETEEARAGLRELYQTATGQAKRDIWARLAAPAYANRISRLQALRDRVYGQARMVGLEEVSYVRDRLADTLEQSYYRTTFDLQQEDGRYYDFSLLEDNDIKAALAADWSGSNWSARIWDNNRQFAEAVEDTVTVGLLSGLRYDEMRDNLLAVIGLDDSQGARYRAKRLIQTECNYIANQGRLMGYQAAGIEQYIFLATLDLRTSQVCRSLDMQRFPVAEAQAGVNLPPMHPNCRSTTIADTDGATFRRGRRFARDPETGKGITVPGGTSYREWYEQYVTGRKNAPEKQVTTATANAKIGKTKYAPSPQRQKKGIQLPPKKYARLTGVFNTRYPNLRPEDGIVTIYDANYRYEVQADGFGGFITTRRVKLK